MAEVEVEKSHGKTELRLLKGRELFIARDIRSLKTTGQLMTLPFEVCIILTDLDENPLDGDLYLYYKTGGVWKECSRVDLTPSDWLFSLIPANQESYHPIGAADGYFDFELPETYMSSWALRRYHYHKIGKLQDILDWLNALYTGYFYAFYTNIKNSSYDFYHPDLVSTIAIHSKIKVPGYTGTLKVGLSATRDPVLPDDWLSCREYHIFNATDEWINYLAFHTIAPFYPTDTRYIIHQIETNPPSHFKGDISYWNVT